MRARRCIVTAALSAYLVATSSIVRAECDPAKPIEPFASRFEVHGDTVYDRSTDLTWTRCSYGQQWTEEGGCSGSVKLLDWHSAMGQPLKGDADWRLPDRDELQSIVARNCKKPAINDTVFPGHRRSSTGQARQADRPMHGSCSFGLACQRGIF
jgi:hypothetical protein